MSSIDTGGTTGPVSRDGEFVTPTHDALLQRQIEEVRLDLAQQMEMLRSLYYRPASETMFEAGVSFSAGANYTTAQTGTNVYTVKSPGKRIAITAIFIGSYASTSARLLLWFAGNNITTYVAGQHQLVFGCSFAPAATAFPGAILCPCKPIFALAPDHILKCTTDANLSVDIAVHGYETT